MESEEKNVIIHDIQRIYMKNIVIGGDFPGKSSQSQVSNSDEDYEKPRTLFSGFEDTQSFKPGNAYIHDEEMGPQFYPVKGNVVTPPIIPKNLPEEFSSLPISGRPKIKSALDEFQKQKIRDYVGGDLSEEDFEALSNYCSPNHLRNGNELTMPTSIPICTNIVTYTKEPEPGEGDCLNIVKNTSCEWRKIRDSDDIKVIIGTPLVPGKDLLFRVRVYRPFVYGKERNNGRHSVFTCDVVMVGRSRLSTLRERIVCSNDVDVRMDVSANPYSLPKTTCKELFPSGFLFINNVFYVDEREGCIDYSEPIREWAKKRGIGDFPKRDMNSVRLDELILKLGHPEVYVHQGNCEHLFTFSEIRLLGPSEPLLMSQFPRHTAVLQNQTVYCTTCAEFGAKWVAVDCERVPFDPAFFCDTCFKLYLYAGTRKIGNFKAYSYRGNEINLLKPLG